MSKDGLQKGIGISLVSNPKSLNRNFDEPPYH